MEYSCRLDTAGRRIFYRHGRRIAVAQVPRDIVENLCNSRTYLTTLPPELREELAEYVPYAQIPYDVSERYWKRRGARFGAETPTKKEYTREYQSRTGCTYGMELIENLPECFLRAVDKSDNLAALDLVKKAIELKIPVLREPVAHMESWNPGILTALLFTKGFVVVLSELPLHAYYMIIGDILRTIDDFPDTDSIKIRNALFASRAASILNDPSKYTKPVYLRQLQTRSTTYGPERDYNKEIWNEISKLKERLRPSPEIVEEVEGIAVKMEKEGAFLPSK